MTSTSSPRRPARKLAVAVAAAVGVSVALTGCGVGAGNAHDADEGAHGAEATTSASAPASTAPEASPENQCGGETIDHEAPVIGTAELLIDAPVDRIWDVHTDVESWDEWQPTVLTIERLDDGAFAPDSQFRWTTPLPETAFSPADTMTVTSSVQRAETGECVLWGGPGAGESIQIDEGIHLWTFTEVEGGTLVHTEESWDAELLTSLDATALEATSAQLSGGLDEWLRLLAAEVEARA